MTAVTTSRLRSVDVDQARFLSRWLRVWIILLAVVVLVVVVYLVAITQSLAHINKNLGVANTAVTGAGGHTKTLPNQIQGINGSLVQIDTALKPITGQADQIVGALTTINTSLQTTDGSLKDTSSVLSGTGSSLVNTSSVLASVLGTAQQINSVLIQANLPAGNCGGGATCGPGQNGVQNIHQRVGNANTVLASARADTGNVVGQLQSTNSGLTGVCNQVNRVTGNGAVKLLFPFVRTVGCP